MSSGERSTARARRACDELVEAELSTRLARQRPVHDLIVSADTLYYFGALEELLSGAATALRPGERLVFTVARAEEDVTAYRLTASSRYSHAEPYVREALARALLDSATGVTPANSG